MRRLLLLLTLLLAALAPAPSGAASVRLKEVVDVEGLRDNALLGYGLVVGLPGTGDSERVFFTSQSISSMLGRLGIRIDPNDVRTRNVAAVMVTASLPTYTRPGSTLDVTVSSIGNARSLAGGVLLVTPLRGPDGEVYAVAQGPVEAAGWDVRAAGSRLTRNMPTTGRIPAGANVERSVSPSLGQGPVRLGLKAPDFTTAVRVADAVNAALGTKQAVAVDPATVEVTPGDGGVMALMAKIEGLEVDVDQRAKVVINERTGTVVAGAGVRIREVAIAHGGLEIRVDSTPLVSQPAPFGQGRTTQSQVADVTAKEGQGAVKALPATTTVGDLVAALNGLGATPRDLVAILQAMKVAGALDADLEVM